MEITRHVKVLWFAFFVFIISICLLLAITNGGNIKLKPSYNINEPKTLKPEVYDLNGDTSLSLFPVPQDNTIGTNDLNNAITLISFHRGRIKYAEYFKDVVDDVEGGGEYIPIVAPDTIGFGQSRRFLLYNFRTRDFRHYRIVDSLDETIEKIAIADPRRRQFIFEIEEYNSRSDDSSDKTFRLLLMDLSGKEARLLKDLNIGKVTVWTAVYDKIFLHDLKKDQMTVLSTNYEPSHHPLADVINRNKGKIDYTGIHPHPFLPFAILSGGDNGSTVLNWGQGRDNSPHLLLEDAQEFSFSPDGNWVAYKTGGIIDIAKTYIMPVSEKYPHYLGTPIFLLDNYFNPNNCGWTTNPISFVGSSSNKLYRWELTKEAHPWIDKPTLHDYVVDYDLEKLKKEKQQGPGGKHK
jgi:hypothetical protein